ncbi:hypothetical protein ACIOGZ_16690 [Kitasatospora sp. NPDC088160]|uniref:hypothetical protein n=1 Tax=Kitasatospora sp. NPDC088160 TaxID=3364072 RepID=UPI00380898C8
MALANSGVINGGVSLSAHRAPESGYLFQVEAISAAEFRGRERELAEVAAFCTGDSAACAPELSYWRWLAPAWSGKSALLAAFVLEPPAGVDIVSFFITSRLARQNDAAAFCEVVQRQLYSLLNEEEPLSTPHTRDEQLLLALNRAAQQCASRGRRLVLVVDGLDEDRGVTSGPDCHSIAALLPRVPPHGMRIVVAGRPHPPVPGDVPADHPLRNTGIDHRLEESPHARAARWLAEQDLTRLLNGGGLGRDLVALTLAAGGGLSAHDLAELAGSRPRLVERELSAVGGRSFGQRSANWAAATGPEVYLFAHEEIRQSAADLVTGPELTGCRARLHQWAQRYRDEGWPSTTPEYLLRGYTQLLQELGDSRRLVELVGDRARHERLWRATGSDLNGLSELASAIEQLLADSRRDGGQDMASVLRLAVARDQLHSRTANLPSGLISLWARLGNTDRAVNLARSRPMSYDRVAALAAVAQVLACAGRATEAFELVDGLDSSDRPRVLQAIAGGLAETGRYSEAWQVALSIASEEARAGAFVAVIKALASAGGGNGAAGAAEAVSWAAEAVTAVETVDNTVTRTKLCSALAASFSRLGDVRQAVDLVDRTVSAAGLADEVFRRAQLLAHLAREISSEPRLVSTAREIALASATLVEAIDDPEDVDWIFPQIAAALAATGRPDAAMSLVDHFLTDESDWDAGVASIGQATAEAGDPDLALRFVDRITDAATRTKVLNAVGEALGRSGDTDRCVQVADQVLDLLGQISDPWWHVSALVGTAGFLLGAGLVERARDTVATATTIARDGLMPRGEVSTLIALARALQAAGHEEHAYRAVRRAEVLTQEADGFERVQNLTRVVTGLYSTGRHREADDACSLLLEEIRRDIHRSDRAEAMQRVAEALGGAGRLQEAGELAVEILALASTSDSRYRQGRDKLCAAEAFLAALEPDRALGLLGALPADGTSDFLAAVVGQLVDVGDLDRALDLAETIDEAASYDGSLGSIAAGKAAAGEFTEALALLEWISFESQRERALPAVIREMAMAGAREEARDLTDTISGAEHWCKALAGIAESFGNDARGRVLLIEALSRGPWNRVVPETARVAHECLPMLAELVIGADRAF